MKNDRIIFDKKVIKYGELVDCRYSKEKLPKNFVSQIFFGYEIQVNNNTKSEINFDTPCIISDLTYDHNSVFFLLHNS